MVPVVVHAEHEVLPVTAPVHTVAAGSKDEALQVLAATGAAEEDEAARCS